MTILPLDWNAPQTWLLAILVLALLVMPFWLISRQRGVSNGRKAVRFVLHGLLWLAVLGLWLQPRWQQTLPSGKLLLAADNVPADSVRSVAAGLGVQTIWSATALRALKTTPPVDTVWVLGQDFPGDVLAHLSRQVVRWIPYNVPGQVQQLHWKGIVRQGERQTISGKINTPESGILRLRFGQQTVDSSKVAADDQAFRLSYVAFSRGRTQLTLWLDKTVLDTVRFVARPAEKLRVRFVLDAPDFETRALADWLGQQGNAVELTNRLSTGIGSELTINKSSTNALPDLVITDPANVGNSLVTRTLAAGKSVLVLNLSRPDVDVPTINRALRTSLQVRRIPGKDTIRLSPELTALPFQFQPAAPTMFPVANYPVMIQSVTAGSRVAVSLLAETFPLRLSGDSTAYARLWLSVMALLRPVGQNNIEVNAPVLVHQPARFEVNNAGALPTRLRVGADTLILQPAPVNTRSYEATGRFATAGWLPVQDSLAVYAYATLSDNPPPDNGLSGMAQREQMASWIRAHRRYDSAPNQPGRAAVRTIEKAIPDWGWLLIIGLLLSALWLEPKLG